MSAFTSPQQDAITFALAAALEKYGMDMDRLVDTWLDMELYGVVSQEVEEIRLLAASGPTLSVPWVELLIAHAELIHCLWRRQFAAGDPRVDELRVRHAEAVATLRRHCIRLLSRPPDGGGRDAYEVSPVGA